MIGGRTAPFLLLIALVAPGCKLLGPLVDQDEYRVLAQETEKDAKADTRPTSKPDQGKVKKPVEVAYQFHGGTGIARRVLADIIRDYMIDLSRDPERVSLAYDAMLEIEDRYHERGYPLGKVEHRVQAARGEQPLTVIFEIDQGPLVTVRNTQLRGDLILTEELLMELWPRRGSGILGLGNPLYVVAELVAFAQAIQDTYRREGYLDVQTKVTYPDIGSKVNLAGVDVVIEIDKGPSYRVGSTTIDPALLKALGNDVPEVPRRGTRYRPDTQSQLAIEIVSRLRRRGHHDCNAAATTEVQRKSHEVDLQIKGQPGPRARITELVVAGNSYVSTARIRAPLEALVGKMYDSFAIREGLRRLYRTGLFRKIEVQRKVLGDPTADPQNLNLTLAVEETKRYAIEPGIGYGSYEGLRGLMEFRMRSLPVLGTDLALRGTLSDKGWRGSATLTDPDFLDTETTWQITGDVVSREEPSFTERSHGLATTLSRNLTKSLSGKLGYSFRVYEDTASDVIDPGAQLGRFEAGSVFAELENEARDSMLLPRRGHREYLRVNYFDPAFGGGQEFSRLEVGWSAYLPIVQNVQLVLSSQHGWLFPRDGSNQVPIQERLFNGGETTVRSFKESKLGPKDINGEPVGGEFRNVMSAEFRWQILKRFELAAFLDAGNVGTDVNDYTFSDLSYGIGGGFRILLPIGPVRFDAAYNPDRNPGERVWTSHFSVGYPF